MIDDELAALAHSTLAVCRARHLMIATVESCTGGLVSAALTAIAGSSDVFDRGFVTYSNEAKQEMIGVPGEIIARFGAVSEECARAMAEGALRHSRADVAVSITGIAGPGGGTPQKPVGLVWIACAMKGAATQAQRLNLADRDRAQIRRSAAISALEMVVAQLDPA
jgi:nicotinamide-nucleotide amidase